MVVIKMGMILLGGLCYDHLPRLLHGRLPFSNADFPLVVCVKWTSTCFYLRCTFWSTTFWNTI